MTELTDHPYVAEYLRRFDLAAASIPATRRAMLREEIAEHLRDIVPPTASDDDAARAIAQFGSPAEVLADESGESNSSVRSRASLRWMRYAVGGTLIVGLVVAALFLLGVFHGTPPGTSTPPLSGNPVGENPEGPERTTTGRAYFEYLAAIEQIEHPLPDGADYPLGVPLGLDAGSTADGEGMTESGGGAVVAHFSWLCAWESEYLLAVEAGDDKRQVDAEAMIVSWAESDFYQAMGDTEEGWVRNVIDPMRLNDPAGVKADRAQACAQAGILNVGSR